MRVYLVVFNRLFRPKKAEKKYLFDQEMVQELHKS